MVAREKTLGQSLEKRVGFFTNDAIKTQDSTCYSVCRVIWLVEPAMRSHPVGLKHAHGWVES